MFNKMLLATAAVIVTVAGASAADLPSKKAAPATYVKICDTYGAGFFYIPGSDTCLKVGGRVRYDLAYSPAQTYYATTAASGTANTTNGVKDLQPQDTYGMHTRGRINVDARTASDYGTVRTYIGLRTDFNTGLLSGVKSPIAGTSNASDLIKRTTTQPVMEFAFIQFAGFTAGKMAEIVSGDWFGNMYNYNHYASFSTGVFGLAYTAILPGGFSATVGIEDNSDFDGNNVSATAYASAPYGTPYNKLPVIAGKLAWDQAWGQIQVSGGLASNRSVVETNAQTVPTYDKTMTGWAIGGQLTLNADMIAKGDKFYVLGGYSNGLNKLGYKNASKESGLSRNADGIPQAYNNFTCDAAGNICQNTTSLFADLAFLHYWTPSVRQNMIVGMAAVNPGTLATGVLASGALGSTSPASPATQKATFYQVGTNLIWSPVKALDIGLEVMYDRANVSNNPITGYGCAATSATPGCKVSGSALTTRLRVQRDF